MHHLVGSAEAAAMLGVSRQRLSQLSANSDDFPAPEAELASGRVWATEAIEEWKSQHPLPFSGPKRRKLDAGLYACLSDSMKRALVVAEEEATTLGHKAVGPLHLLLGLFSVSEATVQASAEACGLDVATLREATRNAYDGGASHAGKRPLNPGAKEAIQRALFVAFVFRADVVRPGHLLRAIAESPERATGQALKSVGVRPIVLSDAVAAQLERVI